MTDPRKAVVMKTIDDFWNHSESGEDFFFSVEAEADGILAALDGHKDAELSRCRAALEAAVLAFEHSTRTWHMDMDGNRAGPDFFTCSIPETTVKRWREIAEGKS